MDTNDKTSALYEQTMDFTKLSPEDLARVTTRDGRAKVEIISTKGRVDQPIIGYVGKEGFPKTWCANGRFFNDSTSAEDLILSPAPRVYYANAYELKTVGHYQSAEEARLHRTQSWLALYKIVDNGVTTTIEVIERNETSNRNP